jgi:hypothetical protein
MFSLAVHRVLNKNSKQLYELEVTTSQGVYYIDRTFDELAELNTTVRPLSLVVVPLRLVVADRR